MQELVEVIADPRPPKDLVIDGNGEEFLSLNGQDESLSLAERISVFICHAPVREVILLEEFFRQGWRSDLAHRDARQKPAVDNMLVNRSDSFASSIVDDIISNS